MSDNYINTTADEMTWSGNNTGWSCPKWGGEETSQCFLCKWQKRRTPASSEQSYMEICVLDLGIVLRHLESSSSELLPSALTILIEDIITNSYGRPCQPSTESVFYYTFSVWDKAAFHLAPSVVFCLHAPVNDYYILETAGQKFKLNHAIWPQITPLSRQLKCVFVSL